MILDRSVVQLGNIPCRWSEPQDEGRELLHHIYFLVSDRTSSEMYQWYQIMICLLKFDFFFFGGVTMQVCLVPETRMCWVSHSIAAPNSCAAPKFCRIWSYYRCYTYRLDSSHSMRLSCAKGDQGVRNILAGLLWFSKCISFRVMGVSLVMMLAALSYCKINSVVF
jgi:hypothetical protein